MKLVQLIHNPTAGDEAHSKDILIQQIENAGFGCRYRSTKEPGWKELDEDADLLAIAGGDGTVRKVVKQVLRKDSGLKKIPLAVIPLGTANNLAGTFNSKQELSTLLQSWKEEQIKKVDVGKVENVPDIDFFLEGFGFGIFPMLMKQMKKREVAYNSPEEELQGALKTLHKILLEYEPRRCELEVDGTDHSGTFYVVEVMNIRSIGPNMLLAPMADPGDGELEIVLVPEAHKEKFSSFLIHKLTNSGEEFHFHTLKGKKIRIRWNGTRLHADDKMLKLEKEIEVCIEIKEGALQFIVPADESANG
ncbi:MAG TPA: diacylglycerol kinase family protein [Flavisolibacter sp.]|nr:diacylglycerol kinase family protein [Flavisolibacter sp.]